MSGRVAASNARATGLYGGDGCELHAHCFTCPRERCIYDEPAGAAQAEILRITQDRFAAIRRTQEEERLSGCDLAQRFGVSRRTVARALAAAGAK